MIGIDFDGVLADLHRAWLDEYNWRYKDNLTPDEIHRWALHRFVKAECGRKVYRLRTPDLYGRVQPIPGAIEGVQRLREAGHMLLCVSADTQPYRSAKADWLARYGLQFDELILTRHKHLVAMEVLIDDAPHNLEREAPFVKVIFSQPWNQGLADSRDRLRANSWDEVVRAIEHFSRVCAF